MCKFIELLKKNPIGIFIDILLKLQVHLGVIDIFLILSYFDQDHGESLSILMDYLLCSFLEFTFFP